MIEALMTDIKPMLISLILSILYLITWLVIDHTLSKTRTKLAVLIIFIYGSLTFQNHRIEEKIEQTQQALSIKKEENNGPN